MSREIPGLRKDGHTGEFRVSPIMVERGLRPAGYPALRSTTTGHLLEPRDDGRTLHGWGRLDGPALVLSTPTLDEILIPRYEWEDALWWAAGERERSTVVRWEDPGTKEARDACLVCAAIFDLAAERMYGRLGSPLAHDWREGECRSAIHR